MSSGRNICRQVEVLNDSIQSTRRYVIAHHHHAHPVTLTASSNLQRCEVLKQQSGRNGSSYVLRSSRGTTTYASKLDAGFRPPPRLLSRSKTAIHLHTIRILPLTSASTPSACHLSDSLSQRQCRRQYVTQAQFQKEHGGKDRASPKKRIEATIVERGSNTQPGHVRLVLHDHEILERCENGRQIAQMHTQDSRHVDIVEARNMERLRKAEEEAIQSAKALSEFWKERDPIGTSGADWRRTFENLKKLTPLQSETYEQFMVKGPLELLLITYHYLSEQSKPKATPSRPFGSVDKASLIFSYPSGKLEMLLRSGNNPLCHPEISIYTHSDLPAEKLGSNVKRSAKQQSNAHKGLGESLFEPMQFHEHLDSKHWTVANFAEHVKRIANYRHPSLLKGGVNRQEKMSNALENLFDEVGFDKNVFSYSAVCDAITFMLKQRRPIQARRLLEKLKAMNYPPTMDVYNRFLLADAQEYRLNLFNNDLQEATSLGLLPNEMTWVALATAALKGEERQEITQEALTRGFAMNPAFAAHMSAISLRHSLGPFLDDGGTTTDFVRLTNVVYNGSHWLAGDSLEAMVDVLAGRGRLIEAVKAIDDFTLSKGMKITWPAFHALLAHCWLQQASPEFSVWLLNYSKQHWRNRGEDDLVFELLFNAAWRSCHYNLCHVIWVYAMSSGKARFNIRWHVMQSLSNAHEPLEINDEDPEHLFQSHAGSVICKQQPPASNPALGASDILEDQRLLVSRRTLRPFEEMTVAALLLDKEWATDKHRLHIQDRNWLINNVIDVPMTVSSLFEEEEEPRCTKSQT